jgi:predicted ATP-grasp superfamily ATP-dependent carboligase
VPVIAVDTDGNAPLLRRSRNIARVAAFENRITDTELFVQDLAALGGELAGEWRRRILLFPTEDGGLRVCADHFETLKEHFILLGDPAERDLEQFMDKGRFFGALLDDAGYVPWTRYYADVPALRGALDSIPFPVVVKPSKKDVDMSFQRTLGTKLIVLESAYDMTESFYALIPPEGVVVQELIEHTEGQEVCWWGYRSKSGEVTGMTARELRKFPLQGGTATFMRSEHIERLHVYAREILERINFWGLCELPFLPIEDTQQYKVLELNPRCWLQLGLMHTSGLNAPLMAYNEAMDERLPIPAGGARERATWMSPEYDLLRVFRSGRPGDTLRNLARWLQDLNWADERAVWTCREPGVLAARFLTYPAKLWKNRSMIRRGGR